MTYIFFLQVLSNTVATALRLTGKDEVEETARFVTVFDRLFDCLNVADLIVEGTQEILSRHLTDLGMISD